MIGVRKPCFHTDRDRRHARVAPSILPVIEKSSYLSPPACRAGRTFERIAGIGLEDDQNVLIPAPSPAVRKWGALSAAPEFLVAVDVVVAQLKLLRML